MNTGYSGFTVKKPQPYNLTIIEEEDDGDQMLKEAFGRNLRRLRTAKNLTQENLGDLAKINYKYIGEIERGLKNPTAVVVYKLSQALGVSVSEILKVDDLPGTGARENVIKEVERLFSGRDEREIEKAIRILEVLFE